MKRLAVLGVVVILMASLLLPLACSGAQTTGPAPTVRPTIMPVPTPTLAPRPPTSGQSTTQIPEERMIIRNGDMSLVVKDVLQAFDRIVQIATSLNGYVVSSRISGEQQDIRGFISIRVPDDKFDGALSELRKLAVRVNSESTNSQDVTQEYIDLQSRLKNAEATESQYLALLGKAQTVEEILKIYDSLSRVRGEIEQLKGRIQYLERVTSMSLINVNLEPEVTAKPLVRPGWSAIEVLKAAVRGLTAFAEWLGTIVLWLLVFIPVWGTILGVILWRLRKKRAKAAP